MNLVALYNALTAVCPVHGVTSDRVISFMDEATPEQRAAAQAIADAFDLDSPDLQAVVVAAVQRRLDEFAQTRAYDGILSAATYATSTVAKFAAEGQYAVEARDAHWAKCYEILAQVQAGQRPLPTLEEVLAELPALTWPEVPA